MAHLGLLLASDHYPALPRRPESIDGQLKRWLRALGHDVMETTAYNCFEGHLPAKASDACIWLVSGPVLGWHPCCRDLGGKLRSFLRAAAAFDRPIFAVNHGEHVLHDALAGLGELPPETVKHLRSTRNPITSFQSRDRLFAYNPVARRIMEETRPEEMTFASIFGRLAA